MQLTQVRVENFKCVEDSTPFKVGPITCLVGKNESGKTALLDALYRFNPVVETEAEFLRLEYPRRHWSEYKERADRQPDNVLTTTWRMDEADRQAIDEVLGTGTFTQDTVQITKGYGTACVWPDLTLDEPKSIGHFIRSANLYNEEKERVQAAQTIPDLVASLKGIDTPSERESALLQQLEQVFGTESVTTILTKLLMTRLPKFVYFADYHRLPGQIFITDLLQRKTQNAASLSTSDRIFLALLELAGTNPEEINDTNEFEALIAELEAVENRISAEIFDYWSQNKHLKVKFSFDAGRSNDPAPFNAGWVFRTRIANSRHGVSVSFDDRSTGFVWFFSFLVWFSQLRKNYGDNLYVLMDEPGLSLHGTAQRDLLRYFNERVVPQSPVIYTTHSPFMIDPENLLSVRTVEDVLDRDEPKGTKVGDEVLSTDRDTIFPLQAALCYDVSQTLFVGKYPLLVEGPSDLLYLKWFARQLRLRERTYLDPRWTISVAGGIDKMASFVTLFRGKGLNTAIFCDFHSGDKKKVERLRARQILSDGHVFTADAYTSTTEADIEDVMGTTVYVALVNKTYALDDGCAVRASPSSGRVLARVEAHFGALAPNSPEFDHYEPAVYLTEHVADAESADALPDKVSALERFERLFRDLNALMNRIDGEPRWD